MKVIDIPATATVTMFGKDGEKHPKEIPFKQFLIDALDSYMPSGRSLKQIRQAAKVVDLIEAADGILRLEDADYDLVKSALHLEGENGQWIPGAARQMLKYFDAVATAQDVPVASKN